ncbi:MAG: ABC transporter permease [Actinobacteria bacterium]|nr:ABC transporter permease [Actinomycetota bacterium]
MKQYVAKRIGAGIIQVILVSTIAWVLFFLIADLTGASPAARVAGKNASPAVIQQVSERLGTNRPYIVQYLNYMWNLLHGDFGYSYYQHRSVISILLPALETTASLVLVAVILWLLISIPFGLLAGLHAGGISDYGIRVLVVLGISVPVFLLAPMLNYLFAYQPAVGQFLFFTLPEPVTIFPVDGYVSITTDPFEWLRHLILPAMSIACITAALYVRYIRALTMENLGQDYVRTALAKGVRRRRLIATHMSKNMAPIVVTLIGLDVGVALGGVLFVENVFALPGLGYVTYQAISNLDYAVASGAITFAAIVAVTMNTLIDIAQGALDPRTRT